VQCPVGEAIRSKVAGAREQLQILQIELAKLEDARETPATKQQRGQLAHEIADIEQTIVLQEDELGKISSAAPAKRVGGTLNSTIPQIHQVRVPF
jgi:hypothetical protein